MVEIAVILYIQWKSRAKIDMKIFDMVSGEWSGREKSQIRIWMEKAHH